MGDSGLTGWVDLKFSRATIYCTCTVHTKNQIVDNTDVDERKICWFGIFIAATSVRFCECLECGLTRAVVPGNVVVVPEIERW